MSTECRYAVHNSCVGFTLKKVSLGVWDCIFVCYLSIIGIICCVSISVICLLYAWVHSCLLIFLGESVYGVVYCSSFCLCLFVFLGVGVVGSRCCN